MAPQKRPDGSWRVQYRDTQGKVRSQTFGHKKDADEFQARKRRERELIRAGMEAPKENILFLDLAREMIRACKREHPESTWRSYERHLRLTWLQIFGTRPVQTITRHEILKELNEAQDRNGWSNATRNRNRATLHLLWEFAIDNDKALVNPVTRIPLISEKAKARKTDYWSDPASIETYIAGSYAESQTQGTLAEILLWSGLRIGEALALQLGDLEFSAQRLIIRRTLERDADIVVERTKGGGERMVPMFPRLKSALLAHVSTLPMRSAKDFLLQREGGKYLSYWTVQDAHERVIENTGLKRLTIHDLRRCFASNAERAGFGRGDVQRMLGHALITTTETYVRKDVSEWLERAERVGFGVSEKVVSIGGRKKS